MPKSGDREKGTRNQNLVARCFSRQRLRTMIVCKECAVCRTHTRELYNINSLYVCLPCIANDGWHQKMASEHEATGIDCGLPVPPGFRLKKGSDETDYQSVSDSSDRVRSFENSTINLNASSSVMLATRATARRRSRRAGLRSFNTLG